MAILPYINFDGNAKEAILFYADVFQATPKIMYFKDMPEDPEFPMDDAIGQLVLNAQLEMAGTMVMISDIMPGMNFVEGNNISLTVVTKDVEMVRHLYEVLSEEGEVQMELQKTFWAPLYGMVKDRYGIIWQLSAEE